MTARIQFAEVPASASNRRGFALQHPFFRWLGLRATLAQHTRAEHEALMKYARGAGNVVEIGVAEGASAAALREAMSPHGTLCLIDPFHLSRLPALNFLKRAARRVVSAAGTAQTVWIEDFSQNAVRNWNLSIDFLLIDGDHAEKAVERDWADWSPFVKPGAVVAFHDARLFPAGWTTLDYGAVRFVDRAFRKQRDDAWTIVDEVDSMVFLRRTEAK
jgi:predicted O-methyltransferase YrrM